MCVRVFKEALVVVGCELYSPSSHALGAFVLFHVTSSIGGWLRKSVHIERARRLMMCAGERHDDGDSAKSEPEATS